MGLINFGRGWTVDYNPPEPSDDELYAPDSDMEPDDNNADDNNADDNNADDNENNEKKDNDEDGIMVVTEKTGPEME